MPRAQLMTPPTLSINIVAPQVFLHFTDTRLPRPRHLRHRAGPPLRERRTADIAGSWRYGSFRQCVQRCRQCVPHRHPAYNTRATPRSGALAQSAPRSCPTSRGRHRRDRRASGTVPDTEAPGTAITNAGRRPRRMRHEPRRNTPTGEEHPAAKMALTRSFIEQRRYGRRSAGQCSPGCRPAQLPKTSSPPGASAARRSLFGARATHGRRPAPESTEHPIRGPRKSMPFSGTWAPDPPDPESYIRATPGQVVICDSFTSNRISRIPRKASFGHS